MFSSIREFCEQNDPAALAATFTTQDHEALRAFVTNLDAWLDRFMTHLRARE